jgi:hypothetical protein
MRLIFALALVAPFVASCTPYLPMKDDFGVSAAAPKDDIPPEYASFNAYDPGVNALLADQICATPVQPRDVTTSDASPGQIVTGHNRCATHQPIVGSW